MEDISYPEAWNNEREAPFVSGNGWQKVSYSKRKSKTTQIGTQIQIQTQTRAWNDPGTGTHGKAESRKPEKERLLKETERNRDRNGQEEDCEEPVKETAEKMKQKKPKKPKKPKVSVVEATSAIDASDLAAFLVEISESYPNSPNVQLMRCADYFGRAFNSVGNAQFGWNRILKESSIAKAIEIPLCYLSDVIKKVTLDWISTIPVEALGYFVIWALNDVLSDLQSQNKGLKTMAQHASGKTKIAILVVLALVLRKKPDALVQKVSVLRSDPNYQSLEKLPMLAWTYGQAAQGDLVAGMYLWVQNLLPFSVGKVSTPVSRDITLQFVESLPYGKKEKGRQILLNSVSRKGERLVPPSALDSLMHAAFPSDSTRTKATERFAGIYPLLKELALGGSPRTKATKPVALQLLPLCLTAASEDVEALYKEACCVMVWCLSQNTDCYKQWEGLYLDNLKGSTRVLGYLCSEWQENVQNLTPLQDLKRTIKVLRSKGGEHKKDEHEIGNLLKSAEKYCISLQKKMSGGSTCKAIALAIGFAGISISVYTLNPDIDARIWDRILTLNTQGS